MDTNESLLLTTQRFQVWLHESRLPNGSDYRKAIIRHPGAVVILPLVDRETICLIENFRPAIGKTLLELPAGTREPGETALFTAQRELTEETGYIAAKMRPLCGFFSAPGILDERMEVFEASQLTVGPADRQDDESIENRLVRIDESLHLIREGEIEDAKTIAALLWWTTFHRASVA